MEGLMEEDVLGTTAFQMFLFKRPCNVSQQKQGKLTKDSYLFHQKGINTKPIIHDIK